MDELGAAEVAALDELNRAQTDPGTTQERLNMLTYAWLAALRRIEIELGHNL